MKLLLNVIILFFFVPSAMAGTIVTAKDWTSTEGFIDSVAKRGCMAETTVAVDENNQYKLQVIILKDDLGNYAHRPMVVAFPSQTLNTDAYFEAESSTEKTSKPYSMTLLQSEGLPDLLVGSRLEDTTEMIEVMRRDYKFTLKFMNKNDVVHEAGFSLAGSNKAITSIYKQCGN